MTDLKRVQIDILDMLKVEARNARKPPTNIGVDQYGNRKVFRHEPDFDMADMLDAAIVEIDRLRKRQGQR